MNVYFPTLISLSAPKTEWVGQWGVAPTPFVFQEKLQQEREKCSRQSEKKWWYNEAYTGHMKVENRVREESKATSPYHVWLN